MEKPLEITYRDVSPTPDVEAAVRGRVDKLEELCDHIVSCSVAIEDRQKHQRSGSEYRVRVDVRVPPRHELVAVHHEGSGTEPDTVFQALNDAFGGMEQQLRKLNSKQNADVQPQAAGTQPGVVIKHFKVEGYGFLRSLDGREVYFHRNSVLSDAFDRLEVGAGVAFNEESGEDGPQATSVHLVDKTGRNSPSSG